MIAGPNKTSPWVVTGFVLLLSGLIAYGYLPSLWHAPRADHWAYLTDTMDQGDFGELVAHTWSYSRTRLIKPGDAQLFRPFLFVVLAAEKALFGHHFRAWQATGIVLHWLVCLQLFLILRRLRTLSTSPETPRSAVDLLPYAVTIFFATSFVIVEQVIWSHISGYLVFTVLVLAALYLLLGLVTEAELPRRRAAMALAASWLLLATAAFTYELGQFCAVCVGLFLAAVHIRQQRARQAVLLLALFAGIAVLYQSANHLDRWYHRATYQDDSTLADVVEHIPTEVCTRNLGRYLAFVVVQPFLPLQCTCELLPLGKMCVEEQLWLGRVAWDVKAAASLAILGLGVMLALLGAARLARDRRLLPVMLLGLAIAVGHMALIVCGRLNLRTDLVQLSLNPYYAYITMVFLLIAGAVPLLGVDRLRRLGGSAGSAVGIVAVGLLVLSVASLDATRRVNVEGMPLFQPLRGLNAAMVSFMRKHGKEPNLRLAVVRGRDDPKYLAPTVLVLYHRYCDATCPTHLVMEEEGRVKVVSVAEWRAEHPDEDPVYYPDLLSVQRAFFVMRVDDLYYGVHHAHLQTFLTEGDYTRFPLCRASLAELLSVLSAED